MNEMLIYEFPERIKEIYQKHFPEDENITYGNLLDKIDENIGKGGISGGYQVTFKVNEEDYYFASCEAGNSITAPPDPTVETGKTFTGWKDKDNNVISFPYTPSDDIELNAGIVNYDFGLLVTKIINGNQYAANHMPNGPYNVIVAFDTSGYAFAISKTAVTGNPLVSSMWISSSHYYANINNAFTYNGETYYYGKSVYSMTAQSYGGTVRYVIQSTGTDVEKATELLNAYFGVNI